MHTDTDFLSVDGVPKTANSSIEITEPEKKILDVLMSGGELRGWYSGRVARYFELLTDEQFQSENKRGIFEIGTFPAVPQEVIEQLIQKGFIEVPPPQRRSDRMARAKLLRNYRIVQSEPEV